MSGLSASLSTFRRSMMIRQFLVDKTTWHSNSSEQFAQLLAGTLSLSFFSLAIWRFDPKNPKIY